VAGCAQVTLVTKGLVDREAKLRKTTEDLWQQAVTANQELTCFRALAANEVTSILDGTFAQQPHCLKFSARSSG
jgi:hypothetical protein